MVRWATNAAQPINHHKDIQDLQFAAVMKFKFPHSHSKAMAETSGGVLMLWRFKIPSKSSPHLSVEKETQSTDENKGKK
jgi:hypothetical protein